MHIESWHKVTCPDCDETNWVCIGDISDPTEPDCDGFRCWSCGEPTSFEDLSFLQDTDDDDNERGEGLVYRDGMELPE